MAGVLDVIKGLITGDPIKGIKDLIEEFHKRPLTPDEELRLKEFETQREQIQATRDVELAKVQGENIRAETTSQDAYVRRARPTFLYIMIAAIGMSLIVFPLIALVQHGSPAVLIIPDTYLELFGVGYLGYTGARTWEKSKGVK